MNKINDKPATILLVDRSGQIFWRSEGKYTAAKGAALEEALRP